MKRIVCIGGGTGLGQVLRGLRSARARLTGIVGVTDNGGHAGAVRREIGMPAVGDLRSCIAALCPTGDPWGDLLRHRFHQGELDGISTGNLILAAFHQREGRLSTAVRRLVKAIGLGVEILPVSDGSAQVCAKLEGGREVRGEWEIILRRPRRAIETIFHRPRLRALPEAAAAVRRADLVVFAPGCLMTSIVSAVRVGGIGAALKASRALTAQVVNLMTQPGQTDGFGARAHLEAFENLSGVRPDAVLVNTVPPSEALLRRYGEHGAEVVEDDLEPGAPWRVLRGRLIERPDARRLAGYRRGRGKWRQRPHFIRHDSARVVRALRTLLR